MMQDARHQVREDLRKDPNDLAHEADRARAELEHTLEALERRLSPGEIMDQMLDLVRRNGGEFGTNLATQFRNNPMPTLLAGAGLTWLIASSSHAPHREAGNGTGRLADHASSAASATRGAAGAARSAAGAAQSTAHGAVGAVRNTGTSIARASRSGAESMRETYVYMSREQPLVLGALAVAAGAAIGALLPSTRAEDDLMGEASEEAKDRLRAEGERRAGEVKDAAADMAEAAERRVERESERGGAASGRSSEGSVSEQSESEPGRADPLRPGPQA